MDIIERCCKIEALFNSLENTSGKILKDYLVKTWRENHPVSGEDLDYCFEILAGKHKIGFTYLSTDAFGDISYKYCYKNIKDLIEVFKAMDKTQDSIASATKITPPEIRNFIRKLVNREYKLGYSNKDAMITDYSPMLAKKYPETFQPNVKYYIQEKLDGNRCITYYDFNDDTWHFLARSGKPLKVNFDMSWANKEDVFDGEVMTKEHRNSRDFNATSGAINSKYGDKSGLHYYIYDIIEEHAEYEDRLKELTQYAEQGTGEDCTILPVLDEVNLYPNTDYNWYLDDWLDKVTAKGGEGVILRLAHGKYEHKRSNNLLKYKKTQTMDLRIVGYNEGQGKYEGLIGSFVCEDDDHTILVNVGGMSDEIRASDPEDWFDKIIEVAYFDISQNKNSNKKSLRFPRFKKVRDDKNTTSTF